MQIGNWFEIVQKLEKYNSIVIFHHIRPDGDCLGSQFGLRELLRTNYPHKKIYAVGNSFGLFGSFMEFDFDEIPSDEVLQQSLGVIVDANFKERIQDRAVLDKNLFPETIRIDHHPNEDDLPNCTRWVDAKRIAADEMITELAVQANWKITPKAAEYLFLGIVTDSGRFMFQGVSAKTHELVALLYKNGLDSNKIFRGMSETSLVDFELQNILIRNMKTQGQVAWTTIDYATTKSLNKLPNEVMRVNLIGNIKGFPLWVQFLEEEDGRIRVEFRSNGPCVRNVAVKWGGGGHERASGCMVDSFDKIDAIIADCNAEVLRFQNQ
ncbi:DHH family phosphoesterase [Mycoplasmopsis columbinasalis]|uniref:Bifunctional oligoribonuclease and PAP phosphatase nrnA n=1 Tax=Mycoplasmopsis columbinasalis TaxID=114880 RepID=A0A449BA43_9BACT|nr:bifunctional oligoribonuclease/PAP phosphatase NrnA [Mycoplasmopsis columbinasalis]VEU78061.1 Bifunctional oligoribonuclease and PAP phosphatase nrnA [Mycoplasmopsis columbinasalis]